MSLAETIYTARFRSSETIERGRTQTLNCPVFRLGVLVAPSSGTITIYRADGTVVASAVPVTIASSIATYSISSGTTAGLSLEEGWLVEWALAMPDLVTHTFRTDAALVRRTLYPVITDADLQRRHSDLPALLATGVTSYQDYLDEAWATLTNRITAQGKRPYLIIQPSALREVHLMLTLHMVFLDYATSAGDSSRYQALADHYMRAYTEAWNGLRFFYDESDENKVDPTNKRGAAASVWTNGRGGYPMWRT